MARALVGSGCTVAMVARGAAGLARVAEELGGAAAVFPCDLTSASDVAALVRDVRASIGYAPDVLVNNAGVFALAPVAEMPEDVFTDALQTNLVAPFRLIRAFAADMRARGSGHIVTVGSVADRSVMQGNGAYSPAKYGLRALHEVLRLELRGSGVRVGLISPGPVDTPIWDDVRDRHHARELPTGEQMLTPEAVANALVYMLTQPEAVNVDELRMSRS